MTKHTRKPLPWPCECIPTIPAKYRCTPRIARCQLGASAIVKHSPAWKGFREGRAPVERNVTITVPMPESAKREITDAARRLGYSDPGDWLRHLGLQEAERDARHRPARRRRP